MYLLSDLTLIWLHWIVRSPLCIADGRNNGRGEGRVSVLYPRVCLEQTKNKKYGRKCSRCVN